MEAATTTTTTTDDSGGERQISASETQAKQTQFRQCQHTTARGEKLQGRDESRARAKEDTCQQLRPNKLGRGPKLEQSNARGQLTAPATDKRRLGRNLLDALLGDRTAARVAAATAADETSNQSNFLDDDDDEPKSERTQVTCQKLGQEQDGRRVPTFGSIPSERLTPQTKGRTPTSSDEAQDSSGSSSSRIPKLVTSTPLDSEVKQSKKKNGAKSSRKFPFGYSNLSNLFPRANRTDSNIEQVAASKNHRTNASNKTTDPQTRHSDKSTGAMRRLSGDNQFQHQRARSSFNLSNRSQTYARPNAVGRPASVSSNYLGAQQPAVVPRHFARPAPSYIVTKELVTDPDCPVHGQTVTRTRSRQAVAPRVRTLAPNSTSTPDLLYDGTDYIYDYDNEPTRFDLEDDDERHQHDQFDHLDADPDDGYGDEAALTPANDYQTSEQPAGNRSQRWRQLRATRSSLNLSSPEGWQDSSLHDAYYNNASKFSVYHSRATTPSASRATGPRGVRIRSSLAPTNEQLRRILGQNPIKIHRPVYFHPQWAFSRPFAHLQPVTRIRRGQLAGDTNETDKRSLGSKDEPKFVPFNQLRDSQAIRAIDFHPSGQVYAVGSNSRTLRICAYPAEREFTSKRIPTCPVDGGPSEFEFVDEDADEASGQEDDSALAMEQQDKDQKREVTSIGRQLKAPRVLFKYIQIHRGSIYCVAFNSNGRLLASGSNDQTVQVARYNPVAHNLDGDEYRLNMHNGTIRDLCFIDDSTGAGSLLLSAGGGDNKIYVTDCETVTPFQSMAGHTQMVMALAHCGGAQFASASYDRTVRMWDLRSRTCTSIVSAPGIGGGPGAPVCSMRVDPSGRLLASGHTDSSCMLYDVRGSKIIQSFRAHEDEVRAISFSPKSYYLLTGSYDGRLVVSDLQGDLTRPLPSVSVAECPDKVVEARWHPNDLTFVSTSADRTATLWTLPPR